jgi:glycosyltransferase involved in cell wall biosynthesis
MVNVSVILPVYNSERYISEALLSVLRQSYRDCEVIVIDDGSSDRTGAIVKGIEAKAPTRIRYLFQRNRGAGAARNTGIKNARGRYLAFLDADDVWLSEKLKRQVELLRKDPATGMVYCDNYFIGPDGNEVKGYRRMIELYSGSIALQLFNHYLIITSSALLRKECVEKVGGFREDLTVGEDYDLFLRIAYEFPVALIREKLYKRRLIDGSLSRNDWTVNAVSDLILLKDFVRRRPSFYRAHRAAVKKRLGSYHFALGYESLKRGRNLYAARNLFVSLRYRVFMKTLKCLLLCLLPYQRLLRIREKVLQRITGWGEIQP